MFGLEFSLQSAINAVGGGIIGGLISLLIARRFARKDLRNFRVVADLIADIANELTTTTRKPRIDEERGLVVDVTVRPKPVSSSFQVGDHAADTVKKTGASEDPDE